MLASAIWPKRVTFQLSAGEKKKKVKNKNLFLWRSVIKVYALSFFLPSIYTFQEKHLTTWRGDSSVLIRRCWDTLGRLFWFVVCFFFFFVTFFPQISSSYLFFCDAFVQDVNNTIEWVWRDLVIVSSKLPCSQAVPIFLRLWTMCRREYLYLDSPKA